MAGLWADNPDYYDINTITRVWTNVLNTNGALSIVSGGGRRSGTNCLRTSTGGARNAQFYKTLSPSGDAIIAFALKIRAFGTAPDQTIFGIGDGTVWHITVLSLLDGTFAFYRGGTLIGSPGTLIGITSASLALNINDWNHISIRTKIDDSTGTLQCRINGVEALNGGAGYSGIDTRNGGTAGWTRFAFATQDIGTPSIDVCDVVVCDSSGSVNNDHPGDCAAYVRLPSTGNGGNADFTPSAGTDHGALVDETVPNDGTDYNQGSTGQRDTYNYPSISAPGTPLFTITRPCVSLDVAGSQPILDVVRSGGVNYDGASAQSPTVGYQYFDFIREQDPATSAAWTLSGVNGSEFGVKVQ